MNDVAASMVMCVYNGRQFLREAIDSALCQTADHFELIIVDDGSTDDSPRIIASYRDPRIRVIRQDNQGLAAARNTGVKVAHGAYVTFLDADDLAEPERLHVQQAMLDKHQALAAVGSGIQIIDETGRPMFLQGVRTGEQRCRDRLFAGQFYNYGSALMIRREALINVGAFRTFFAQREDVDFMLRLAERYPIDNVPEALYRYRINTAGLSHRGIEVGLYYHEIAYALHRERMATGSDRLQQGVAIRPYEAREDASMCASSRRRVLAGLHMGEAERLREEGHRWLAARHAFRAITTTRPSGAMVRDALHILR